MSFTEYQDEDARWWKRKSGGLHDSIFALVDRMESDQSTRIQQLVEYQRLYEDRGSALTGRRKKGDRVTYNIVKSCIDTAAAKIAKNRPRPLFLTSGGDYQLQERAKKLTKFTDGVFSEMGVYRVGQLAFRDAEIFDGGAVRVYVENDRIRCERAMVSEIFVDTQDAYYGKPRQLHQKRRMDRDVLCDLFPSNRMEIRTCPQAEMTGYETAIAPSQIEVIESWHLQSSEGADDGRHSICIENGTLLDEDYVSDTFPFVFMFWNEPVDGFWSPGLAEELRGIQSEINRLLEDIRTAQRRLGRPYVAILKGSEINKAQVNNEIGAIIEYDMDPPIFGLSNAMPPEIYQHLERLYAKAYEITGISQLSARGQKPAGLDSGRALREFQDIESERFVLVGQRYEQLFMDIAKKCIGLARELYEDGVDLTIRSHAGKFLESIAWGEVDLQDDQFDMQVFPVSLLPTTPAGRYEAVVDLANNQLITPDQAKRLLDFPDIEQEMTLDLASQDAVRMVLDGMLGGAAYEPPEPFYDLEQCKRLGVLTYLRGKIEKVDEEHMAKIRDWLADVDELVQMAMAGGPAEMAGQAPNINMPPPDPMAGAMPPGMPGMPPGAMPPGMPMDPSMMPPPAGLPPGMPIA
jgi:hypothetical protein